MERLMAEDGSNALSPAHRETIHAAVAAAFGTSRIEAILPVGGGASGAFPFRVDVRGRRYLVRVEGEPSPLRNPHQYASMRIAAEAGIAPCLHHADEAARVAVMGFIEEQPISAFPGGASALAPAIGELLARVQMTAPFPRFVDYPDIVGRLWAWVCRTGLFAPGVLDPSTEHLRHIRETYVWDAANSVSSHNDPVPRNVLFDGRRLWLIDWESAYRNDPLVDVAIVLDSFALSPGLEPALLRAWLGGAPDDAVLTRLPQVRALTRLYYAGVFLSAAAAALGPIAQTALSGPSVAAFRRAIRDGDLDPDAPATKLVLGKMYVEAFLTGDPPPGFGFDIGYPPIL
jgi:Phosphotransferase enzyme family